MRMRGRSNSSDAGSGFGTNVLLDQSGRTAGQGWLGGKLRKLLKTPQAPPSVGGGGGGGGGGSGSATDGLQPLEEEKPAVVRLTFEQNLEEHHLLEADRLLIEREQRLFGEITESEGLSRHQEEVEQLAADRGVLDTLVFQTLMQSLSLGPEELNNDGRVSGLTAALRSAVEAVQLEEQQDQLWRQSQRPPPSWRPCVWRKRHDSVLRLLVEARLDNPRATPTTSTSTTPQSSLQADMQSMGRQLKEDLLVVVTVLKSCYPPHMDICNLYARMYHQSFGARLRKIADFGLDDKDCTSLLLWSNKYYPGILQKPELVNEIDAEALGKLLPDNLVEPLEEQFLSNQQSELMTYVGRVLEEEKEKWTKGEEPTREDGCYVSTVACDIILLINGMVTSAQTITGDLHKAQSITGQLKDLMQRYKAFHDSVIKQNRANSRALIKANLGCIQDFRDFLVKKSHLFPNDVRENCLSVLNDMKQSAHTYLINPVHKVLKPQYQKLGTSDWLKKNLSEKLLISIEKELLELQGSAASCQQELMGRLHQEVTEEYVRRLLRGDVKLKDREKQQKAYVTVKDDAEGLHKLFSSMGSQEVWLKEILTKIAEVLKLQDVPAIQMQIFSLGSDYPDLSEKQVSALLKLKTTLSRADRRTVKDTLVDALKEASADANTRPFFCKIIVK